MPKGGRRAGSVGFAARIRNSLWPVRLGPHGGPYSYADRQSVERAWLRKYNRTMMDRCPHCDYSLAGLPANHTCPECGLPYDERSEAYFCHYPVTPLVVLCIAVLCGALQIAAYLRKLPVGATLNKDAALSVAVYGGFIVAAGWVALRACRRGHVAAVLPRGLYVRLQDGRGKLLPWTLLNEPVEAVWYRTVRVRRTDGSGTLQISGVFKNRAEVERLKAQIEERIVATYPVRAAVAKYREGSQ